MLTHPPLEKLPALRLTGMLKALSQQMQLPDIGQLDFDERLGLLVDREVTERSASTPPTRRRQAKCATGAHPRISTPGFRGGSISP